MHLVSSSRQVTSFQVVSLLVLLSLVLSSIPLDGEPSVYHTDPTVISSFISTSDVPAGSDMIIKYSSTDQDFSIIHGGNYRENMSDSVKTAIVKSPIWIQQDLARQFQAMENPEPYAWLLLNASKQMTDELAFSIAASPLADVASVDVLYNNVYWLYEIDKDIKYADIIDYDDGDGNYYSTIRYQTVGNGTKKQVEYPKEIYYWYVVHPEILGEHAQDIYGEFWRSFLYNHNDMNYPLLKEKINQIPFLWDHTAYSQPGERIWDEWITMHPTAVEAVSYWVGKTVPFQATGDRPNQPNIIAHEHNGWCGELQRLSIAAMRTALIPTIGACNIGEDHVWREFYDEGWHQNDNWWSDSGGTVDTPKIYWDGWGKTMSAIYTEKGDGAIYDDTSRYIDTKDRLTVTFDVLDGFSQPYDGARVTVLVKGIKDITWYKQTIWDMFDEIWQKLPDILKEKILTGLYSRLESRFEQAPDVVDGVTVSIWNYTNMAGRCSFELGNQDEYVFLIQAGTSGFSWPFARWNTVRFLNDTKDTSFRIQLPIFNRRPLRSQECSTSDGPFFLHGECNVSFYQVQENIRNKERGTYQFEGTPVIYFLDTDNYYRYLEGKTFEYIDQYSETYSTMDAAFSEDVYIVCINPSYQSTLRILINLTVTGDLQGESISFCTPSKSIFENPCFNVGDRISISGFASSEATLYISDKSISLPSGHWIYQWVTDGLEPGLYHLQAACNDKADELSIQLFDGTPPIVFINISENNNILHKGDIINGWCTDENGIQTVLMSIDTSDWIPISHEDTWSYIIADLSIGIHQLQIKTIDRNGLSTTDICDIVIEPDNEQGRPQILSVSQLPLNVTNTSNVIVLVNCSSDERFPIKTIHVSVIKGTESKMIPMFRYADDPILPRHAEDPFYDASNLPQYGCELGTFLSGDTMRYMITVRDVANRIVGSEEYVFTVA